MGDWLVTNPRGAKITFTGSPAVGRQILSRAGIKKVTLELGNTSPVIIAPDADLDFAAKRCAVGAYYNSGPSPSDTAGGKIWRNDVDRDRDVDDLSFNAPENKYNFGITVTDLIKRGTYASLTLRHLDEYDFISGSHWETEVGIGKRAPPFQDRAAL